MCSIVQMALCKVVKHQVDKKKTAINLFLRGSQIQFDHIQWPFRQPFLSQVSPKTVLKSTVWNNTQARLHHDQHDGPETLTRWRMDIWKCSGQSRNFSSWLIVGSFPKHKGGKQGNGLVSHQRGKGWRGKLAEKEVWREEKISKLWISQSNNSDKKLSHQNHDWDQSTKICWDPYLLLNVNINSCQQIN